MMIVIDQWWWWWWWWWLVWLQEVRLFRKLVAHAAATRADYDEDDMGK